MGLKAFFGLLFLLFVIVLLFVYWFLPSGDIEFFVIDKNTNFTVDGISSQEQFYQNMRFPSLEISYRIDECALQKRDDMERAFEIVSNLTVLDFFPVSFDEEISVMCSGRNKIEEGLFIAGEGGPTTITQGSNFNVIFRGNILLLKDSKCPQPNVAIHELFHVLGFNHSDNPNNIMFPVSKCNQEISGDMIKLIDNLYSVGSYPDLTFENVSAIITGRTLDTEFTVRNFGLDAAENFSVTIYADERLVKEIEMNEIEIGYGRTITLENLFIPQLNVDELEFSIESSFQELDKENNKINLEIKDG